MEKKGKENYKLLDQEKKHDHLFVLTQLNKNDGEEFLNKKNFTELFKRNYKFDKINQFITIKSLLMESVDNITVNNSFKKILISDLLKPLKDKIKSKLKTELDSLMNVEKNNITQGITRKKEENEEEAFKFQKKELDNWEAEIRKNREKDHLLFQNIEPEDQKTLLTFQDKIDSSTSFLFSDIKVLAEGFQENKKEKDKCEFKVPFEKNGKIKNSHKYIELREKNNLIKSKKYFKQLVKIKKNTIQRIRQITKREVGELHEKRRIHEHFKLRHKDMNKWTKRQKKRNFINSLTKKYLKEKNIKGKILSQKQKIKKNKLNHNEVLEFVEKDFENFDAILKLSKVDSIVNNLTFMKKALEKRKVKALKTLEEYFLNKFVTDEEENFLPKTRKLEKNKKFKQKRSKIKDFGNTNCVDSIINPNKFKSLNVQTNTNGKVITGVEFKKDKELTQTQLKNSCEKNKIDTKLNQKKLVSNLTFSFSSIKIKNGKINLLKKKLGLTNDLILIKKKQEESKSSLIKKVQKKKKKTNILLNPEKTLGVNSNCCKILNTKKYQILIKKSFAYEGDEEHGFLKEKKDLIDLEFPQEKNNHLLGWNSWAGPGLYKIKLTKKQKLDKEKTRAQIIAKRQDKDLKYAIINQKRTKLISKYTLNNVPYPFENEKQYNKSIEKSLGPEWLTQKMFKKNIRPSISIPMGTLIPPIEYNKYK